MKKIIKIITFLVILLLILSAGLVIFITTKPPVEIAQDEQEVGLIAELSNGNTFYDISGPVQGEPIILVHGSIVPSLAFDKNFSTLAEAGFRVVKLDLYGRGLSSRPKVSYTMDLYLTQIKELLDSLNIQEPANFAGASMGGALVILFAEKYPQLVKRVILLDPVTPSSFTAKGGELIDKLKNRVTSIKKRIKNNGNGNNSTPITLATDQFKYEGVGRSIFSAVANLKSIDLASAYEKYSLQNKPTLLIWGSEDDVIPVSENVTVREAIVHTEYHEINGAGHMPHYEKPETVNPILLNFLWKK